MKNINELIAGFKNPDASLRGTPFWSWNTRMTHENIDFIVDAISEMGMGGAYMHVRTGLENKYLSEDFFEKIRYSRKRLSEKGMYTCLYDEDRWPSGTAGGFVTADPAFRQRFMIYSDVPPEQFPARGRGHVEGVAFSGERTLLGKYAINLENGLLKSYRLLNNEETASEGELTRWAWIEVAPNERGYAMANVDTLNPQAIDRFIELTHEAYKREVGDGFGKDIPTIFSDEPAFSWMQRLTAPDSDGFISMPYTDAFEDEYQKRYGESFIARLPEIFYLTESGRISQTGYRYHDLLCDMFVENYCCRIGAWCEKNNLKYTGHLFREDDLDCMTYATGDVMRCYKGFGIPGVDVLSDRRRITTVKQVASACHQKGVNRAMCEIYGVTNWNYDFRGHKLSGDWQAALGITNRVHHLTWTSMKGNAKRDYPASIGPQSPWYKEYNLIETYFSRLNAVLTEGKPCVRVGVIHPIESFWLYWGPDTQTQETRDYLNDRYYDLCNWLLFGLIDFDYISEGFLRDLPGQPASDKFLCGSQEYDVIVVPDNITMRRTTLERLKAFSGAGGRVIFLNSRPSLIDAAESNEAESIRGEIIPFTRYALLNALRPYAGLDMMNASGSRPSNIFTQLRSDGDRKYLFLSHVYPPRNQDIPDAESWTVSVDGTYTVTLMDALTGKTQLLPSVHKNGKTSWDTSGYAHTSWLFMLTPGTESAESAAPDTRIYTPVALPNAVDYSLEEQNVLLLDMAEYAVDSEEYYPREEMRRISAKMRAQAGLPASYGQPWQVPEQATPHVLNLRFNVRSEIETHAVLAMESPEGARILVNGEAVSISDLGAYVDLDIRKVCRIKLARGANEIKIALPISSRTLAENLYLLGGFGVRAEGAEAVITELPSSLTFTDIARQNLAFYSGTFTLHIPFELKEGGDLRLTQSMFRCPLIKARLDGDEKGTIAFAPYKLDLGHAEAGKHELELICFGNRDNTFGALHLSDRSIPWKGPNMWTSTGEAFSYEYQLKETGLLKAPVLEISK